MILRKSGPTTWSRPSWSPPGRQALHGQLLDPFRPEKGKNGKGKVDFSEKLPYS